MALSEQLNALAQKFETEYASAKEANLSRYEEALGIQDQIIAEYSPGGGFGAGVEASLQQQKTQDVGRVIQHQIDSGLFGVQTTGGAAQRWEREVGSPARLQLQDLRSQRYTDALQAKEGVIERRTDAYPDFRLIADLYRQAGDAASPIKVTYPATRSASDMYSNAMQAAGGGGLTGGSAGGTLSGGLSGFGSGGGGGAYSTATYGGAAAPAPSPTGATGANATGSSGDADLSQAAYKAWWNNLTPEYKKENYLTGAMAPGGYLSNVSWAQFKQQTGQTDKLPAAGTAYGDYLENKAFSQPGTVNATYDEFQQITQNLNDLYGTPTGVRDPRTNTGGISWPSGIYGD
jgi:hypothetical protein